jgi:hypothetical protein
VNQRLPSEPVVIPEKVKGTTTILARPLQPPARVDSLTPRTRILFAFPYTCLYTSIERGFQGAAAPCVAILTILIRRRRKLL